jgi:hypothetical protein
MQVCKVFKVDTLSKATWADEKSVGMQSNGGNIITLLLLEWMSTL